MTVVDCYGRAIGYDGDQDQRRPHPPGPLPADVVARYQAVIILGLATAIQLSEGQIGQVLRLSRSTIRRRLAELKTALIEVDKPTRNKPGPISGRSAFPLFHLADRP